MSSSHRGFSLVETMVAAALLGLIGAGLLTTMSFSARETAATRLRTIAAADAQGELERLIILAAVNGAAGGDDARRCALFEAKGGPMDATTGGTASGTCPGALGAARAVTGIPIPKTTLVRAVTTTAVALGRRDGLDVTITVSGTALGAPVVVRSQIRK